MNKVYLLIGYLAVFYVSFYLLKEAGILELNTGFRSETISRFIIMIIFPVALARWGIRLVLWLIALKNR